MADLVVDATFNKGMRARSERGHRMAGIHSFIYGIDADNAVRKITVSKKAGATQMLLDPLHGAAGAPVCSIVQNDREPLEEAKRVFDLEEAIEVPADLDGSAVGEKVRADLEVRAVARKEAGA